MADQAVAFNVNAKKDCVTITISQRGDHAQPVAGSFAFHPQFLASARVKRNVSGLRGALVCLSDS